MSPRNVTAAVVALAVVALLTLWLAPLNSTGGLAFAEMQHEVEKTKTVQYVETRQAKAGGRAGPKTSTRVMILGRYLRRAETRVVYAGDKLEKGMWSRGPDHSISIYNAETGKLVSLLPEKKLFFVAKSVNSYSPDDLRPQTSEIKPHPEADFYGQIRRVPADKAEKLPERTVDGKKAIGFRVVEKTERKRGTDTNTSTYWVDPQTKLPVRIEHSFSSTDPLMASSDKTVMSDFTFDAPLDKSLFSTDLPKGYSVPPEHDEGSAEE